MLKVMFELELLVLERGEEVIVNLRPETAVETEVVRFDRPRVLRVLARIAADLDALARPRGKQPRKRQGKRRSPVPGTVAVWRSLMPRRRH